MKITFGADPEFFVARKADETRPVVSCGMFGGSKGNPVLISKDGGFLEDGVTVEFNIAPQNSIRELREKLHSLMTLFTDLNKGITLLPDSSAHFEYKTLRAHDKAMEIGCDPDYWAHGIRENPQINKFKNRRFAGGHLHVGLSPWPEGLEKASFVKFLDIALWMPDIPEHADRYRFPFYGMPGLYRETDYGVEYRSLDNYWCSLRPLVDRSYLWDLRIAHALNFIDKRGGELFGDVLDSFSTEYLPIKSFMEGPKHKNPNNYTQLLGAYKNFASLIK